MWSDNECQSDYLSRGEVVRAAVALVSRRELLPLSIGIFGDWGSGKSTLLRLIKADLEQRSDKDDRYLVVEFDAWLYQGFDDTRAALMDVISDALLAAAKENQTTAAKALSLVKQVDRIRLLGKAGRMALDYATGLPVGTAFGALWDVGRRAMESGPSPEDVATVEDAAGEIASEAKDLLRERMPQSAPREIAAFRRYFNEVLDGLGVTLVVIVDNLDRCLPESTIEALEAIRLFLFMNRTAFIIAADQAMVQSAVKKHYGTDSANHAHFYLDKFIQVPLRLPYAGTGEVRTLLYLLFAEAAGVDETTRATLAVVLGKLNAEGNRPVRDVVLATLPALPTELPAKFDLADRLAPMLASAPGVQGNPRIIKRLMNAAQVRRAVAADRGLAVDEELIIKVTLFERCAPDSFATLLEMIAPTKLEELVKLESVVAKSDSGPLPSLPKGWEAISPTFLSAWFALPPSFKDANPAPILYLCREVLALSGSVMLLTGAAREAFDILAEADRVQSPVSDEVIAKLSSHDASAVMSELIGKMRRTADWRRRVPGVAGAIRLGRSFDAQGPVLASFLSSLPSMPPWLAALIDKEPWATPLIADKVAKGSGAPKPSSH